MNLVGFNLDRILGHKHVVARPDSDKPSPPLKRFLL